MSERRKAESALRDAAACLSGAMHAFDEALDQLRYEHLVESNPGLVAEVGAIRTATDGLREWAETREVEG